MQSKDDGYVCSICQGVVHAVGSTSWSIAGVSAPPLKLPRTDCLVVVAETSLGELTVCASCYGHLPSYLTEQDKVAIHLSAGRTYAEQGEYDLAISCFKRAASIERSADVLSAMAVSFVELGEVGRAKELYREALTIDPSYGIARENLANLPPPPPQTNPTPEKHGE